MLHLSRAETTLPHQYGKRNRHSIPIVNINNFNCWHQWYELSISTNRIADIHNSNCRYQQFELSLQQYELSILTDRIVEIHNSNCQYHQYKLSISTNHIVDIHSSNRQYQQYEFSISTHRIVYLHNSNCRYWQFQLSISLRHNRNNTNYIHKSNDKSSIAISLCVNSSMHTWRFQYELQLQKQQILILRNLKITLNILDPIVTLRKLQKLFLHDFVVNKIVLEKDFVS